jgi:CRISPR-associated protein Csd1
MLLNALHELAEQNNLLRDLHVQQRTVHLLIPISATGELAADGVISLHSQDRKGKAVLGRDLLVPRFPGENNGGKAYFLAESFTYVLGIEAPSGAGLPLGGGDRSNPVKSFHHFWEQIETAERQTALPVLASLLKFRERYLFEKDGLSAHRLPFADIKEWVPKGKKLPEYRVCVRTVGGEWIPLAKLTVSFQVDGNFVFNTDPDDPLHRYWRDTYRELAFSEAGEGEASNRGLCMITQATDAPIARSHKPKILRIPGLSSGGYVVSFARESPAFSSYGFEMGENAPISEMAAAGYALGLQRLLDSENHSVRIGPSVVCFWARSRSEKTTMFAALLNRADPKAVADFLGNPWRGIDRALAKKDQFCCVTLSGNAGRVVVRHWMQLTLERAVENFADWFNDLNIVRLRIDREDGDARKVGTTEAKNDTDENGRFHPLALYALACTTVRDSKDLKSDVVRQLYRAALEGTAPSLSMAKLVLEQLRSALAGDSPKKRRYPFSPSRYSLLRLILNRNRKGDEPMIEPQVFETDDEAYNCGRLLAVLAEAQERAHEFKLEGAGISERYFGTASVSPSSVLPLLIRLNRHHLEKIKKSDQYSHHARFIEAEIQTIMAHFISRAAGLPPEFPRYLNLKKQGRFAIGFYQQKAKAEAERTAARDKKKQEKSPSPEEVSL